MHVQQVILSVIGVPGALLAGWMVELPILGRRGTLAISTGKLHCSAIAQFWPLTRISPHSTDWCLPLRLYDRPELTRPARVELRILVYEQHHVRRPLRGLP
jgi:hypothetical protein